MPPQSNTATPIGVADQRYGAREFGISQADRLQHVYIIGQTGTGKSSLLANLAIDDARSGRGFCLIEPHGDLAQELANKIKVDHIYWDVADEKSNIGYNPLSYVRPEIRSLVASGLIDTLKRQWSDAWGARMEHLLRYSILALLSQPGTHIGDITRLFYDKAFRAHIISRVEDSQVLEFWLKEYPNMNYKTAIDGVAPIANKLGAFLSHPVIRKALCAPERPLRFRRLMDESSKLIINLSKGKLGADTSNVVGGLILSNIMHAAFSRHNVSEADRVPFFLYVDEFHAFSTSALAGMLSEVRKYGLGLVLAHQHIQQTDTDVFEAIMGNVGTMIVMRIGANDAPTFSRQFENIPVRDFTNLPNFRAYIRLMTDGYKTKPFSAKLNPPIC